MSECRLKKINRRSFLASPYALWIVGFTILPLIIIFKYALTDGAGAFTWDNLLSIFSDVHIKAFWFSIEIAAGCTIICILLAYPMVLAMKNLGLGRKGLSMFVIILPMWMNFILRILAWQMILSNNGILNFLLGKLGMGPVAIANTPAAIMVGVVYDYLPYMILPIFNAIMDIDEDLIEAARDLGAGGFTVFRRVIFPLSVPGLLSGIVMVFVPSMTSFVVSDILGGGKLQLIGNVIEQEFTVGYNWNVGSGLSVTLMIFVLISMMFTVKQKSEGKESVIW
ncbi:spermidine/putrescine transport system permease protein [Ruminococcaceae bacterium YRB3002]|nr:spermidine/putrescine transport system permease protein [Ruminococcaceae bacterium YRB3002]